MFGRQKQKMQPLNLVLMRMNCCSAGGGSTPSMWVGTMAGQGITSVNDYDGTDKTDDFITGGLGFNIPARR